MRKTVDMTVGSPTKLIFFFTLPIIFNYVLQQLYSLADAAIVALALGDMAVTGVNLTGSLTFLVLGFSQGCSGGFGILLSHFVGAKDEEKMRRSFATSILLTVAISFVLTALALLFSRKMLLLLETNAIYMDYSLAYIRAVFSGIIFTMFYNLASQVLLAFGDSKSPLIILVISALLNIGLNSLLFVFNWSVAWAGYATIISQGVAALIGFGIIFKKIAVLRLKKEDFQTSFGFIVEHLGIGLPMAFQFSITAIGCMIQQRAFNLFPPEYSMGQSTGSKINGIFDTGVLNAFGTAMATYCGQNHGAKRLDRIRQGVKSGFIIGGGLTIGCMVLAIGLAYPMANLLLPDATKEVHGIVFQYVCVNASMFFFLMLVFFFRQSLQGVGKSFTAAFGGVIELMARFVCAFTLAKISFNWACLSNSCAWVSAGIYFLIMFLLYLRKETKNSINSTAEEIKDGN